MKKLIIIILILFATSVFAQDTVKSFTKIVNYGKPDRADWKCFVIKNGNKVDTVCIKQTNEIDYKVPATIGINTKTDEKIFNGDSLTIFYQKEVGEIHYFGNGQSHRDNPVIPISRITEDSTIITLKNKIEADYKADLKTLQELQTKIIKEESYLEILQYLIEEKKKN